MKKLLNSKKVVSLILAFVIVFASSSTTIKADPTGLYLNSTKGGTWTWDYKDIHCKDSYIIEIPQRIVFIPYSGVNAIYDSLVEKDAFNKTVKKVGIKAVITKSVAKVAAKYGLKLTPLVGHALTLYDLSKAAESDYTNKAVIKARKAKKGLRIEYYSDNFNHITTYRMGNWNDAPYISYHQKLRKNDGYVSGKIETGVYKSAFTK